MCDYCRFKFSFVVGFEFLVECVEIVLFWCNVVDEMCILL